MQKLNRLKERRAMNDSEMSAGLGKSGYSGKDSMREKATKAFGSEMKDTKMDAPASFGAQENSKMRVYKKGGHVKHTSDARKAVKGRTKGPATPPLNIQSMKAANKMKSGGKAKFSKGGQLPINDKPHFVGEKCVKHAYKEGGSIKKYAMGGVGKIRHKEATAEGKPIMKKTVKGKSS